MSLKAFHIFFIAVCILFCAFLAAWEIKVYQVTPTPLALSLAGIGMVGTGGLTAYLVHVLKKYKHIRFL